MSTDHELMAAAEAYANETSPGKTRVGCLVWHSVLEAFVLGANIFPPGIRNTDERWQGEAKHRYVVHAELNALRRAVAIWGLPLGQCTLFCTMRPCLSCTREIISCGIRAVIWRDEYADMLTQDDMRLADAFLDESSTYHRRLS